MLDYYARRAAEYDATSYGAIEGAELAELEHLEAFVAGLTSGRVLDVACGTGYLTRLLRGDVVAVDQSSEMLDLARERLPAARLLLAVVPHPGFPRWEVEQLADRVGAIDEGDEYLASRDDL